MAQDRTDADRRVSTVAGAKLELAGGERVRLSATGFASLVNLRGSPGDGDFVAGVNRALGVSLPLTPNRWHEDDGRTAVWLGPDEWLIIAADGEAASIEAELRRTVTDDPWLSVVDVSNSYAGLLLSGTAARDVLAKGCPLDLHESAFDNGHCAQTVLAGTRVLLRVTANPSAIEIRVRNSFARYTVQWLADAMAEFGD